MTDSIGLFNVEGLFFSAASDDYLFFNDFKLASILDDSLLLESIV